MTVGNCLQLSTGSGWDVLQWRGWARPEPRRGCAQACPGCSGFVHAWHGPQGASLEYQRKTAPKGRRRFRFSPLGFLHFPVTELLNKGGQSGFNLRQNILIIQNGRV